jgi:hypothetical protein
MRELGSRAAWAWSCPQRQGGEAEWEEEEEEEEAAEGGLGGASGQVALPFR